MFQDFSVRGDSREICTDSPIPILAKAILESVEITGPRFDNRNLVQLDDSYIDQMLALQDREATGNTIKRTRAALQNIFDRGDLAFGIVNEFDELIAQATLRMGTELPAILCDKFNAAANHAIVGCVMVDPDYAGLGLASRLISKCLNAAKDQGVDYAHARIVLGNSASLHTFREKFSFAAEARGQSPETTQKRIVDFMVLKLDN